MPRIWCILKNYAKVCCDFPPRHPEIQRPTEPMPPMCVSLYSLTKAEVHFPRTRGCAAHAVYGMTQYGAVKILASAGPWTLGLRWHMPKTPSGCSSPSNLSWVPSRDFLLSHWVYARWSLCGVLPREMRNDIMSSYSDKQTNICR